MNFNGIYLKSFGRCKVVSWKNSVYTDFDRKELVHDGRVLAAIEVPTVRKIEAIILVRGNSLDTIRHKLERIAEWLYDAGTARLCHETDLTRYFMARCTQVSKPEYNGLSARVTVSFTCSDHRLYSSVNDQPVTSAENNMSNFTFAGKHCLNDMGCLFVKDSEPALPGVKPHVYEISGMNGTLRFNTGRPVLKETAMNGTLYFVKDSPDGRMTEAEITKKRHDVAAWLVNAERAQLVMDNDISREYQAEVIAETLLDRRDWQNGYLKVKFVVQPVPMSIERKSISYSPSLIAGTPYALDLSSLFEDGIGYETPISINITPIDGGPVTDLAIHYDVNGADRIFRISHEDFNLQHGSDLMISDDGTITASSSNAIRYIKDGDFPVITPDSSKTIMIETNASINCEIVASCNVRWI